MKNKDEIFRFVSELEQYAVECKMKTRILDEISDIRKSMQEGISQDNLSELDRLVEYISGQGSPQPDENGISKEEVQQKIKTYLERCQNSNRLVEQSDRSDCQVFIQDARREMQDYTNVEANFEQVVNEGKFCDAFYRIGQKYAQQTNHMLNQYADAASSNYHNTMDNIRKMLSASGLDSDRVTPREFYQKWDQQQEVVKEGCREKICRINGGEEEIVGFAQEHVEGVAQIMKKQGKRRRNQKLMPLYVLLVFILVFLGGKLLWGQLTQTKQEQAAVEEEKDGGLLEKVGEIAADQAVSALEDKMSSAVEEKTGQGGGPGIIVSVWIAVLLLFAWYLLIRSVDKRYRIWVCNAVGRYLSAELEDFWKQDLLNRKIDDKFQSLDAHMQEQYEKLIYSVLGRVMEKSEEDYRQDRLRELCSQWEAIKREG